ncbi:hypothetical protein [Actinoplanes sp. TFC3]|uniref:hypothetical protein n=1 Tax=Actinoplanes sp. TFC3 TaxID=1710355 RepID=UPI00082AA2F2|nr:hypothetical protein [Actinoplanes sp. TFC3]
MNALLSRLVWAGTTLSALAVALGPLPLTVAGGLLLGLVLPGIALTGALLRGRDLAVVERITLAPALSLATLVISGLVLYVCGAPLNRVSWTAATAGVTILALIAALFPVPRSITVAEPAEVTEPVAVAAAPAMTEAHTIVMSVVPPTPEEQLAAEYRTKRNRLIRQSLPLLLVIAVLGGASWISYHTSRETFQTTVTALSAAPAGPVGNDGNRTVVVSASGLLPEDGPYTVRVSAVAGKTPASRSVAVSDSGAWSETLTVPGDERVTIALYRSGDTSAYRTISVSATE